MSMDISIQLQAVKAAVRKATEEALKSASSQDALELKIKSTTDTTDTSTDNNTTTPENNNLTSSESFALGMTLFGQDMSVIERSIQDKLTKIEKDLQLITTALHAEQQQQQQDGETVSSSPDKLASDAKELKKRIEFLQICSLARASLDDATTASTLSTTNDPDYLKAAQLLVAAKEQLRDAEVICKAEESRSAPSTALFGAYRILDSIRTAIRRKNLDLMSKATNLIETSIAITPTSMAVKGGRSTGNTPAGTQHQAQGLHAAYDVIQKLSPSNNTSLHKSLRTLSDKLFTLVIEPVLTDLKMGISAPWTVSESSSRLVTSIEWERHTEAVPTDNIVAWKEAFTFLQRTLVFFQQKILLDRDDLSKHIGDCLFGVPSDTISDTMKALGVESNLLAVHSCSIMKSILDILWETCIPTSLSTEGLVTLKQIANDIKSFTDPFDAEMTRINLYSDSEKPSPLSDFVSTFAQNYVDKRRTTILNQARTILLNNDYHNTVDVGEEITKQPSLVADGSTDGDAMAVFRLHKCTVSQTATLIMGLTRKTMDEATSPIPADSSLTMLPSTLYRTAREILDLFRAIIPTTFENEIATVPRTAAVLHNDCVFFAHHCLTLGLEYKEKFPPVSGPDDIRGVALRQTCMFVDMVPIYRELADLAMGDMLEKQHYQIHEIVGSRIALFGESLKSNESLAEWVDAETAMKAGVYHAKHLSQAWRPVLSVEVHRRSIGFLMDTIFNVFLDQLFLAQNISEPASHFVSSVFRLGMQGAIDVVTTDDGCLSWDRFSAVGRFMDMSLADINVALSDGVFRSITGPELSRLIVATFDDSEKRRKLLYALEQSN